MDAKRDETARIAREAAEEAGRSAMLARAALIIACMAAAIALLGLFLPV